MTTATASLSDRVSNRLIHARVPLFMVSLVLTAAAIWPSTQLRFDAAITNLFPPHDPVLRAYQESLYVFGAAEIVVVAYADPDLLTPEGLKRLKEFADRFLDLKQHGLTAAVSLADARWPPEPLQPKPLHELASERELSAEQLREVLTRAPLYRNTLLGSDGETASVSLTIRPKRDDVERVALIEGIRQRAAAHTLPTVVAGGPMLTYDASTFVDEDSRTLGWVSTIALLIVIGILFSRLRWVILPLAVVHVSLVWTKALLWLMSAELSMVSTTLTALVTVVGVASVVQVTARYREERERATPHDALRQTMAAAGPAVFWASLTTAAGFASLLITSIVPVRNFAIMLALASMMVFFATAALTPAVVLFGRRPSDPGAAPGERAVEHALEATMDWSLRRPWHVAAVVLALVVFTVSGILRIRAETDFTRNFRASSDIVQAYRFVESRFDGIGTFDLAFPAPAEITPEFVDQLRALETRLRGNENLTSVLGLADVLDFVNTGPAALARNMLGPKGALKLTLDVIEKQQPEVLRTFWIKDSTPPRMRIMLRAREQAPSELKHDVIRFVENTGRQWLGDAGLPGDVQVAGTYTLLNHLVSGLMADQVNTFLLATVAVFVIMGVALRSLKLAFVGLVPKIGPVLTVLGAMGWFGVPIDMGTPMIAAVSLGISVGFSIHYLYRFRQERAAGVPFAEALRATHRRVGGAMVFSNVALVVGFAVLALSNFIPTVHFSVLAAVALVGGLAGNLLVLPLLLKLAETRRTLS